MTFVVAVLTVASVALLVGVARSDCHRLARQGGGLAVGVRQSGGPLVFPPPSGDPLHVLIGGQTGAGKSVLMRVLIGGQAGLADVALVCLDPKRTALGMWSPRATIVARSIAECTAVLVMLWREVHRRLEIMESVGVDEWHPSLGGPFIVVHIDELTEVVAPDGAKVAELLTTTEGVDPTSKQFRDNSRALREAMTAAKTGKDAQGVFLTSLARICRSSGVQLITATQYPESSVLDPQFRSNMSIRVMQRVASDEMVKVILGAGRTDDITADSISYDERGGCWVGGIEGRPIRARGYWVSPEEGRTRAIETAHLRWPHESCLPRPTPPRLSLRRICSRSTRTDDEELNHTPTSPVRSISLLPGGHPMRTAPTSAIRALGRRGSLGRLQHPVRRADHRRACRRRLATDCPAPGGRGPGSLDTA